MTSSPDHVDTDELARLHTAAWPWALRLTKGDRLLAEDVLQTAYLTILDGKAIWSRKSSFKTWVFGVIRMTAKSMRRKQALRQIRFPGTTPDRLENLSPAVSAHTPMTRSMLTAISNLPARQGELIELVFGQDCTLEEAAIIMNISLGSARTHYARAKTALRKALVHLQNGQDYEHG